MTLVRLTRVRKYWHTAFFVELFLLAATAPVLYLPSYFSSLLTVVALALLAAGCLWRYKQEGVFCQPTPANWPVLFLVLVMLPIAMWASPEPLRTQSGWPRALVLIWNVQLFVVLVTYVSRHARLLAPALLFFVTLGLAFALVAPFGTNWLFKLRGSEYLLGRLPAGLGVLSREGGIGFHPNIVAGALLYVLPLIIALSIARFLYGKRDILLWLLSVATLYMLLVFVLLQSRGGYIGLAVALLAMPAVQYLWGRRLLLAGAAFGILLVVLRGGALLNFMAETPGIALGGVSTLVDFRVDLWRNALLVIRDYPFTGVGLGAFQAVASLFYPSAVPRDFYFGHAHNFWLQGAIDFGIPGLIAILAIYIAAVVLLYHTWQRKSAVPVPGLLTGLFGSLLAQSVFSLTDSLSMGTTANLLFWYLFALIFAVGNLTAKIDLSHGEG